MCMNGVVRYFPPRGDSVASHEFSWVDEYVSCQCATSDDETLLNVSLWKVVR